MSPNIPFLRTPASRFHSIPDFSYEPHYLSYGNLRMAYVDESNGTDNDPETFLCLHGQPTWSFLYRRIIPVFLTYTTSSSSKPPSRRVVAPDLFGFGRSDKPSRDEDYTFNCHRESLLHLIRELDLRNITLVVQDWGGLLGLTLPLTEPSRFKRLIVMNTTLAEGSPPTQGFLNWRDFANRSPHMNIGQLMARSTPHLSKAEVGAYDAPFPSVEYKGGVRRFPNLVPISPEMEGTDVSKQALEMYKTTDTFGRKDIFMACGMKDPVLGPPVMKRMARVWKNGCGWMEVQEAGHFVQEWGEGIAKAALEYFEGKEPVEGVRILEREEARL